MQAQERQHSRQVAGQEVIVQTDPCLNDLCHMICPIKREQVYCKDLNYQRIIVYLAK